MPFRPRRSLSVVAALVACAFVVAVSPARAANKKDDEDPDKVCNEGPPQQREFCKRELKKLADSAKKVEDNLQKLPVKVPTKTAPRAPAPPPSKRIDTPLPHATTAPRAPPTQTQPMPPGHPAPRRSTSCRPSRTRQPGP